MGYDNGNMPTTVKMLPNILFDKKQKENGGIKSIKELSGSVFV
jgi:hypothetical protein